jgi:LmbE family N-acetylglucosaminyl deacetylase
MKIIAFGAHPDDLEIGLGGTLAKFVQKGHHVYSNIVTIPNNNKIRKRESAKAAEIIGMELNILDLKPNDVIYSRDLVKKFDTIINKINPDMIFTHWNHDSHQDHVTVSNATIASARRNNCSLYMYEETIPGGIVPYSFRTQMFIDITDTIDKKIKSALEHKSQVKKNGKEKWIEGITGRAMYRGYQINTKYAEAFEIVKEIKTIE